VSLFVLSPEIEDRDEVEVGNWANHKKTFYTRFENKCLSSSTNIIMRYVKNMKY
jgi:hypothetical protein